MLVYSRRIEGAALAWAPSREECLAPGRVYAWLVRADVAGSGLGEWSAPRRFRVPGVPSIEEVDAALALLERWRAAQPGAGARPSGAGGPAAIRADLRRARRARDGRRRRARSSTGVAAIRGEIPDTTGSACGVLGISQFAARAPASSRATRPTGPISSSTAPPQGEPDTLLSERGIDRSSASPDTFNIQNSGAGAMSL